MIIHQDQAKSNSNITIIVLFYNQEKYVSGLLDNIKACNRAVNVKVVLVDDCSPDNTLSSIESWLALNNEMTWQLIKNPSNLGISASILRAIDVVDTAWVKCHAGDDMFTPEGIEEFVILSKTHDPDKAIIMTAVNIINEASEIVGARDNPSPLTFTKYFNDVNFYTNNLMAFSVLAGTNIYKNAITAMYYRNAEDWPLLMYAVKTNMAFKLVKHRLVNYRIHDASIMAGFRGTKLVLSEHQKQLKMEIIGILENNLVNAPTVSSKYGVYIQLLQAKYPRKELYYLFKILKFFNLKYLLFRLLTFTQK